MQRFLELLIFKIIFAGVIALIIGNELKDKYVEVSAFQSIAVCTNFGGDFQQCEKHLEEAISISESLSWDFKDELQCYDKFGKGGCYEKNGVISVRNVGAIITKDDSVAPLYFSVDKKSYVAANGSKLKLGNYKIDKDDFELFNQPEY